VKSISVSSHCKDRAKTWAMERIFPKLGGENPYSFEENYCRWLEDKVK
jgi:hypothetical protein